MSRTLPVIICGTRTAVAAKGEARCAFQALKSTTSALQRAYDGGF
jgi:hypothetical protein